MSENPIDPNCPFYKHLMDEAERQLAGEEIMMVNGSPMGGAIWNLIVSKRDFELWTKLKMKPTRSWKVTDAKKYFGITGSGQKLLDNFMEIYDFVMGER